MSEHTDPQVDPAADPGSTSAPGTTPGTAPGTAPGSPPGSGFFDWLRGLGITRSSDDRWFTGVSGGIAAKAGIDPLIVRGVFVVLAVLGGPGLLLYLAGWLLLPDTAGRIHLEDIFRGRATTSVTVAAVLLAAVVVIPFVFGITLGSWGWGWSIGGLDLEWLRITFIVLFWAVAVPALIVWLILWAGKRGRAAGSEQSSPAAAQTGDARAGAPSSSADFGEQARAFAERANELGEDLGRKANEWGEDIGRKTEAWSERYEAEHQARKLGAGHTIFSIALALLAAGSALLWAMGSGVAASSTWTGASTLPYVLALVAAVSVLAVSMIIAGVRGRNSGWVGFLALCGVVALLFTAVFPSGTRFQPFGNLTLDGGTESGAVMIAGNTTIDLGGIGKGDAGAEVVIWQAFGNSTITLPDDHPTRVRVQLIAGNITEDGDPDRQVRGVFIGRSLNANAAQSDAYRAGSASTVTVRLIAGNVHIDGDYELERSR